MNVGETIFYILTIFIYSTHTQMIQYVSRYRNVTIQSETNSGYMISLNIYQRNMEHLVELKANITKDINVKYIQVQLYRCVYEKSECENVHKIIIDKNMNGMVNMKNQFWSKPIESVKPRMNFPLFRKGIYECDSLSCDANAVMLFYPEATKYYFQFEAILFDFNDKKAITLVEELSFHSFVKRNRNRNRGNSTKRSY